MQWWPNASPRSGSKLLKKWNSKTLGTRAHSQPVTVPKASQWRCVFQIWKYTILSSFLHSPGDWFFRCVEKSVAKTSTSKWTFQKFNFYAGCPNNWTRLLRKSATIIFPSGVNARPCGSFSCPSPSPLVPNFVIKRPSLEKTWIRWLSLSATMMFPSCPTATPVGRINSPSWLPLRPKLNKKRPRESNTWKGSSFS